MTQFESRRSRSAASARSVRSRWTFAYRSSSEPISGQCVQSTASVWLAALLPQQRRFALRLTTLLEEALAPLATARQPFPCSTLPASASNWRRDPSHGPLGSDLLCTF